MTSDCEEENNKEKDYCEKDENGENNLIGEQLDTSKSNIDGGQKREENEKQVRALLRNDSDYECDLLFRKRIRRRESRKPTSLYPSPRVTFCDNAFGGGKGRMISDGEEVKE